MFSAQPLRSLAPVSAPPVVLDRLALSGARVVHVVRDDLLAGGTKERGLTPFLDDLAARGVRRFVYASPFCGYAQIALANAARAIGGEAIVFASVDPRDGALHAYSRAAAEQGARVVPCASLDAAEAEATALASRDRRVQKLPLGFACEPFFEAYESALRIECSRIARLLGKLPDQVFLPVGSGTLLRAFARVLPDTVRIEAVDVNVLSRSDPRIASIADMRRVRLHRSVLSFATESAVRPRFPSNPFYDAKLLPFVHALAGASSLWWNVAQ